MGDRRSSVLLAGIFIAYILIMTVAGFAVSKKSYSASENRYLAQRPEFEWKSFLDGSYGSAFDRYLSDQFPGREHWVGLKAIADRMQGKKDVNGVYLGKDGYLIERFDKETLETEQLSRNLERLAGFTLTVKEWIGESHMRVMLAPSASQILTDRLPSFAAPYDQGDVIKRLKVILKQQGVSENIVIPVEEKLKSVDDQEIYYRTDHHWTAKGAYYAYTVWAESLGLVPWPENAFSIQTVSQNFYGTVFSKLHIPWRADTIELYLPVQIKDYRVYYDGEMEYTDTLYNMKALKSKDQYAVYLDGNHGLTKIVNNSAVIDKANSCLMIIKDSYAHSFVPFAVNHYGTVYMADLRYLNVDMESFMKEKGITDVLVLYQIPGFAKDKNLFKIK